MFYFLSRWLLPHICVLCGAKTTSDLDLCSACEQGLPRIKSACSQCGNPINTTFANPTLCGACLENPPPYERTLALYHYQNPIDFLILGCKFQGKLVYAKVLGTLLARHLKQYYATHHKPEVIIPIPLHRERLRERGYNQSLEIARPIAKALHIPYKIDNCVRVKPTAAQSLLPPNERKENISHAFALARPLPYKHIAVIDDIITTGSTMRELCNFLRRHTAVQKIDVWSVARA
jgi:ComF family protein